MSKVGNLVADVLFSPISLVLGKKVGGVVTGLAMATVGVLTGQPELVIAGLGMVASSLQKKPNVASAGTSLDFVADPSAGQPYVMGDTMVGENVVHEATWGSKNVMLGIVGIISCAGPIQSYDGLYADGNLQAFNGAGENAGAFYNDNMLHDVQLGARPEANELNMHGMPDWSAAHKLSSLAASGLVLKADLKHGKLYAAGVPQFMHRVHGVLAYDPRADSTQVGGSGAQRALDETTYTYSGNPWCHHGTFALGRWVNGVRVIGPGLPPVSIDWGAHMEAASVADFNGWKVAGRVMSTDGKWEVLKAIAQAGGGNPVPTGAKLSCLVNVPRVSLATITQADVRGSVVAPQTNTRRNRINGAIPRFRSSAHGWEFVPGEVIRNATYLAEDGGNERTREIEFTLVVDTGDGDGKDQAAQLAAYEVANSRERTGISVELGLVWSQFKVGDCVTLDLPDALLFTQKAVVIGKQFNLDRNTVTLQFRTEDDAKHAWALGVTGQTTVPPAWVIPTGTGEAGLETDDETAQFIRSSYPTGLTLTGNAETVSGAHDGTIVISNHTRVYSDRSVAITGTTLTGLAPGTYFIYYDDDTRADDTPAFQVTTALATSLNSATNPARHNLPAAVTVPAAGGGSSGGSYGGGGYSGGGGFGGQLP